ncbi:MAG TPA: GNAT family N-acetyltransferase [Beijerinckiaceae bacterium]|jgi:CelD/BcsL family acetyltransferase involved in cellulose biosynthesis
MTALAPAPELALAHPAPAAARTFKVEVLHGLAAAESVWRGLEADGAGSPYQRFDWQTAYVEAMGASDAFEACAILVRDASGRPCLLLPLTIARRQGLRIASPVGGKHANYHLPLIGAGTALPSPSELRAILREAGRALSIDAYAFANLPLAWDGLANPLAEGGRPSPSNGYRLALDPDAEATLQRVLSKDARKKLRQKDKKLREQGAIAHRVAGTPEDVDAILSAFFAQKRERFREMGIPNPFEDGPTQSFLRAACLAGLAEDRPAIELHALMMGERVLAVFGGAVDAARCCGMFTSFDPDPEVAKSSPGELLMLDVIRHQCREGRRVFDLGVGEARYKNSLCDEVEELVDVMLPVTARGYLYAAALAAFLRAKRTMKQTPWLWQLFTRLRARLG